MRFKQAVPQQGNNMLPEKECESASLVYAGGGESYSFSQEFNRK